MFGKSAFMSICTAETTVVIMSIFALRRALAGIALRRAKMIILDSSITISTAAPMPRAEITLLLAAIAGQAPRNRTSTGFAAIAARISFFILSPLHSL